jgi:hypothetical protein
MLRVMAQNGMCSGTSIHQSHIVSRSQGIPVKPLTWGSHMRITIDALMLTVCIEGTVESVFHRLLLLRGQLWASRADNLVNDCMWAVPRKRIEDPDYINTFGIHIRLGLHAYSCSRWHGSSSICKEDVFSEIVSAYHFLRICWDDLEIL